MASEENDIKVNYAKNLKAVDYIDFKAKDFDDCPEAYRFILTFMHDVLKSGRFGGSSVLEIGSGALVHNIAPASAYFTNIVMSDYVEDNCSELKRWLQGKSSIKQLLDIPAEVEGHGKDLEIVKKSIEDRIKARVKHVVRCDVLLDGILMEKLPLDSSPPYDLIVSCFCVECAAADVKSYAQIYKRISKVLRPGGGLLIVGIFGEKSWKVKNTEYYFLKIDQVDLMNSLEEAGFGEIDIKVRDKISVNYHYEVQVYCVAARKLK